MKATANQLITTRLFYQPWLYHNTGILYFKIAYLLLQFPVLYIVISYYYPVLYIISSYELQNIPNTYNVVFFCNNIASL